MFSEEQVVCLINAVCSGGSLSSPATTPLVCVEQATSRVHGILMQRALPSAPLWDSKTHTALPVTMLYAAPGCTGVHVLITCWNLRLAVFVCMGPRVRRARIPSTFVIYPSSRTPDLCV